MDIKKIILALCLLPGLVFTQGKIKNVILLIGDGMGVSQVSTAFYYQDETNFSRFPVTGLINTSSAKEKITDSAAGATAFACGKRSYNGAVSVDLDGSDLETLVEIASRNQIKSGLVATSSITHATPACFYAHASSRNLQEEIAGYLPNSGVDFFAAGGLQFFTQRSDEKDLYAELLKNNYQMDSLSLPKKETKLDAAKKYGFLLAKDGLISKIAGRDNFLPEATEHAINYLSQSENGFFLMVEGSQIDWEGHAKNAHGIISEVHDFDQAIGVALDFAKEDGNTLVIVTADHETGGFALTPSVKNGKVDYSDIDPSFYQGSQNFHSASHTATMVPVFAYGPQSIEFSGIYQNNEIFHKILKLTGW